MRIKLFFLITLLFMLSGFSFDRIDFKEGRQKNVCKDMKDNILLYLIFVDSKETSPWTEFDIQSTLDSLAIAVRWLEEQAKQNNIRMNIITDFHIGEKYTPIKRSLPEKSLYESVTKPSIQQGMQNINEWADKIARIAGSNVPVQPKDGIPEVDKPKNKERLVALLRDKHNVESVALLFMLNNYYKDDVSIPVNTLNTYDIEFAVISYKYPSEIAHNVLHLFGAADLYETPLRKNKSKIDLAKQFFPKDIMQETYGKNIYSFTIGELTQYLIGWTNKLDAAYKPLLKDNLVVKF